MLGSKIPPLLLWLALGFNLLSVSAQNKTSSQPPLIQELKSAREAKDNNRLADAYYQLALYEEEVNKSTEVAFDYFISLPNSITISRETPHNQQNKSHHRPQIRQVGLYVGIHKLV